MITDRFAKIIAITILGSGLLAFLAIGLWAVVKRWHGLMAFDRWLLCLSVTILCFTLPFTCWRAFERARRGLPAGILLIERMLVRITVLAVTWVLTSSPGVLLALILLLG